MYDVNDPRASLSSSMSAPVPASPSEFAGMEYGRFYNDPPVEVEPSVRTWLFRGQNMMISYSEAKMGARFQNGHQSSEYMILLPDPGVAAEVKVDDVRKAVSGNSLTIVPPGHSSVAVVSGGGKVIQLFSANAVDLLARCSNSSSYVTPHPNVAPYVPWPEPPSGFGIRSYSLDVPSGEDRFGRIWRCSTLMINVSEPRMGPRDVRRMSPHSHDDFEQMSLAIGGEFIHHIRWPWTVDKMGWREDEHELCSSPSAVVIPAAAIHTSEAIGAGANRLIDVFSPPRRDFSMRPGWVLNATEYPMPVTHGADTA